MNKMITLGGLFAAVALSGCGGSGDDAAPPPAKPPATVVSGAEGLWTGQTPDAIALSVQGVVLENGETWNIVSAVDGTVVGFSQGNIQASAPDAITGTGRYLNVVDQAHLTDRKIESVSYFGRFAVRDSIQITASNGWKYAGNYGVRYEQPAAVSELLGTYVGTGIGNQVSTPLISLSVTTGGLVSTTSYPGCSVRGTLVPRASGRNVFDLPLTFDGTTCPVANGAVVNHVVLYNNTSRSILIMGQSASKEQTYIYTGLKS